MNLAETAPVVLGVDRPADLVAQLRWTRARCAASSLDQANADQDWRELVNCRPVIDDTVMRT